MSTNVVQLLSSKIIEYARRGRLKMAAFSISPLHGIGLALAFMIAFSLPIFLFIRGINYIWRDNEAVAPASEAFPDAVRFAAQGAYGKVDYNEATTPVEGKGFILNSWFKLNQLPALGQKVMLLAKFDPSTKNAEGYAVGITRDTTGYRPIVYWRSAKGGGWYLFSRFPIHQRSWFLLSLSFREGRLLGLHGVSDIEDRSRGVELLGGYELEPGSYPTNTLAIVYGAYGQNPFRGFVGPVSLFSGKEIGADIHAIVKRLMRQPEELPDLVQEESVVFRGNLGAELISPLGIHSEVTLPAGKGRRDE